MKILFVVTAFYPEQAIGSIRITKFAKFLEHHGDDITVLSLKPAPWATRDESLRFPGLDRIRWSTIDQSSFFRRFFLRARVTAVGNQSALGVVKSNKSISKLNTKIKSAAQFGYTLLKAIDWMFQVRRYAHRELKGETYDVILTSYPSLASPYSGLLLKRMGLSKFLLIDFRDPLSYGNSGKFQIKKLIESYLLSNSQFTTFASSGVRNMVVGQKITNEKTQLVVNNGFDPDDIFFISPVKSNSTNPKILRFVYTGSLYGEQRSLIPFFKAISTVLKNKKSDFASIELHYAGHDGALFHESAQKYGLGDFVINHGRVTRSESLGLQQAADICLLATWNTKEDQGILTGKVFEFFMLQKPVLAIVSGDLAESEIKKIIDEIGAGFCYESSQPDDFQAMVCWLDRALEAKREHGLVGNDYNGAVNRFNFETMVTVMSSTLKAQIRRGFVG